MRLHVTGVVHSPEEARAAAGVFLKLASRKVFVDGTVTISHGKVVFQTHEGARKWEEFPLDNNATSLPLEERQTVCEKPETHHENQKGLLRPPKEIRRVLSKERLS